MKYKYRCIDEEEILDIYEKDSEYKSWYKIVRKILHSNEFQKRRLFRHHEFESVWNHSIKVSFNAYKFAKEKWYKKIVGPVDASFWNKYRLKINLFDKRPYTGEPYNLKYYFNLISMLRRMVIMNMIVQ